MLPCAEPTLPPKAKLDAVPVGDGEGDGEDVAVLVGVSSPWVWPELSV
jgi:hypothetical protein